MASVAAALSIATIGGRKLPVSDGHDGEQVGDIYGIRIPPSLE
jgi:hypothetical protein